MYKHGHFWKNHYGVRPLYSVVILNFFFVAVYVQYFMSSLEVYLCENCPLEIGSLDFVKMKLQGKIHRDFLGGFAVEKSFFTPFFEP